MLSLEMQTRLQQIGNNLQVARKRRKLSVKQAAERIGTSLSSIRRMENGDPSVRIETYLAALEVYQLDQTLRFADPEEFLFHAFEPDHASFLRLNYYPECPEPAAPDDAAVPRSGHARPLMPKFRQSTRRSRPR